MIDFNDLVRLSRFAGERFDLVQAGGGNTSIKLDDGRLYVKASGMALSDVAGKDDFCCVQWQPLLEFLDKADASSDLAELEAESKDVVKAACEPGPKRPSIETLLHCTLGKLTLHTHPVAVAAAVCRSDWKESLTKLFTDAFFVEYKTPGPALALALHKQLQERNWRPGKPALIFLQNHGMIVAGTSVDEVMNLTNDVVERVGKGHSSDLSKYKYVNSISKLVNDVCGTDWLAYVCDDQILNDAIAANKDAILARCATPDQLVYCGPAGLMLPSEDMKANEDLVQKFLKTNKHAPKVVLMPAAGKIRIFLLGKTLKKCKEMEDVLKSHVLLQTNGDSTTMEFLPQSEVDYLSNWEAEKYRQNL